MFCWAHLPVGWDAGALLPRALHHRVAYVPGAAFHAGPPDRATLRLSYSAEPPERIREGLERLAAALD